MSHWLAPPALQELITLRSAKHYLKDSMSYSQAVQPLKKVKKPKIIFNLKDVNTAPELIYGIPENVLAYHTVDKRFSLYLVNHAQSRVAKHNYLLSNWPSGYKNLSKR